MTLGERLTGRDNALNTMRLLMAALVVTSHAWPLGGFGTNPTLAGPSLGAWAVVGFFCISGYLIPKSRARHSAGRYALLRAARIYPGLWTCLAVTAFVFAPLAALLGGQQWHPADAASYVWGNATAIINQPTIGGGPVWNDSLWTLLWELACYLLAGMILTIPAARRHQMLTSGILVAVTAAYTMSGSQLWATWFFGYFSAGWFLATVAQRIRATWWLAAATGVTTAVMVNIDRAPFALPLAATVLLVSALLPVRWFTTNDVSYGTYLYGYPAQRLLAVAGAPSLGLLPYLALSLLSAVALGAASWFLVERHFLPKRQASTATRSPVRMPLDQLA